MGSDLSMNPPQIMRRLRWTNQNEHIVLEEKFDYQKDWRAVNNWKNPDEETLRALGYLVTVPPKEPLFMDGDRFRYENGSEYIRINGKWYTDALMSDESFLREQRKGRGVIIAVEDENDR